MLVPEIANGAAPELEALRSSARAAVEWACRNATSIGVLVPTDTPPPSPGGWSLNSFGTKVGVGPPVGLAEGIARWLLGGRTADVVGVDSRPGALCRFDALLVMGDASAARTEKAPLHHHPQAQAFDRSVVTAIRTADARALAEVDLALAQAVGAAGAPAWVLLGRSLADVTSAELDAQEDPYGVLYFVARWTGRWALPA